ncbi:hypothetical protein Hanom_Chr02g00121721 [Helianthus anomalus]
MIRKMIDVWYPCRALKLQGLFYYFGLTYWAIRLIIYNLQLIWANILGNWANYFLVIWAYTLFSGVSL